MQKRDQEELPKSFLLGFTPVCLISFVPLIRKLGLYWDDWPAIWFLHNWGPTSFLQGFAGDRPLLGWVFMLTTSLLGESPLAWQLSAVVARALLGLAFWWTLVGVWPERKAQTAWIALLFTVYPGFSQQYISVTYTNGFVVYGIFILSLGSMVWAFRRPAWFWPLYLLSILLSVFTIFTAEYFFGLELIRPALLWFMLKERFSKPLQRAARVFLFSLPYMSFMVVFAVWRMFVQTTPRAAPILLLRLRDEPFLALWELLRTIANDFWEVNFLVWLHKLPSPDHPDVLWTFLGIFLGAALITFFSLYRFGRRQGQADQQPDPGIAWAVQAILLGLWTFLVSGWPVWVTQLKIGLEFPFDRFTLMTMPATAILLAGLLGLLARKSWIGVLCLAALVGVSAGAQYLHRLDYRQEWERQKSFFWQLTWRAPAIKPGTILMTAEMPFRFSSDNSLSAPLNWTYAPDHRLLEMPYFLYDVELRQETRLGEFLENGTIVQPYRLTTFTGTTDQALVFFFDPARCVKFVDPEIDRKLPDKPSDFLGVQSLSRLDLIEPAPSSPAQPPLALLGPEPEHDWCYYFEKAELARQTGDWEQVAAAGDQALGLSVQLGQKNASELEPFILGYAHMGEWEKAEQLSLQAFELSLEMQPMLCRLWRYIEYGLPTSPEHQAACQRVTLALGCN